MQAAEGIADGRWTWLARMSHIDDDEPMGCRLLRAVTWFCCLLPVACIPSLENRVPHSKIVMSRTVIMPVFASAHELDASDNSVSDDERATVLFNIINPEVRRQAMQKGARPFPSDWQVKCGEPCARLYFRLVRWGATSSLEVAAQMDGARNYGAHSIAEWKLPLDCTALRNATGADYALFFRVRELGESTGRHVVQAFAGMTTFFKTVAVACVADLARREMVWCHSASDILGDLSNPQEARSTVQNLLSDFAP
jgi:hypothetical protein